MAKRHIRDLNVEFIEDDFWPELKRQRHGSAVTALNRFSSFRQMMQFCVKKKQIPANACYQADITPPERNEVGVRKIKKALAKLDTDNLQRILNNVAPQHQLRVLFAMETGLRIGEQVAVKIYDPKKPEIGGIDFKEKITAPQMPITALHFKKHLEIAASEIILLGLECSLPSPIFA